MPRKLRIDWALAQEFSPTTVTDDVWHTARHEAAHFLAAVRYGRYVASVWIKRVGVSPLLASAAKKGALGRVFICDGVEPGSGDIVCTLAGAAADHKIGHVDVGTDWDIKHAEGDIRAGMQDHWFKQLYVSFDHVASDEEVRHYRELYFIEALNLIKQHWPLVEFLAACFLTHLRKDGELHSSRIEALSELARFVLNGGRLDEWIGQQ